MVRSARFRFVLRYTIKSLTSCHETSSGTLWVSREKTTVYDFYQMFINSYDEDVERLLCFFSDYPVSDVKRMCKEDIINAKKVMAFEVTKLVHGEEEAITVKKLSEEIFGGNNPNNMPTVRLEDTNINVLDLMVKINIVSSKSEARRVIEQGGLIIDKEKISDPNYIINKEEITIQKGKKTFIKVILNEKI